MILWQRLDQLKEELRMEVKVCRLWSIELLVKTATDTDELIAQWINIFVHQQVVLDGKNCPSAWIHTQ